MTSRVLFSGFPPVSSRTPGREQRAQQPDRGHGVVKIDPAVQAVLAITVNHTSRC
jgi:hypothetical protein